MISSARSQAVNQADVEALLARAIDSLDAAIRSLNGDRALERQRQWLELLVAALRQRGMFGLEEVLRGSRAGTVVEEARSSAAAAIADAETALNSAAGLLYHPRAVDELRKTSEAIGAVQRRVASSVKDPAEESRAMAEADYVKLRKFAGMLMGQGRSEDKLKGLAKAREARNEKRRMAKLDARMSKNRGVVRAPRRPLYGPPTPL